MLGGLTGAVLLPNSVSTAFSADLTKEEKKALNSLLSFYEERKEEVRSSLGVSSRSLDQSTSKAELDFELFQAVKLAEEDPNNNENLFNDMEAKITEGLATPQMVLEDLKESDTEIDADAFVIKLEKALSATKEMVKAELKEKKLLVGSGENINYMIDEYLQGLIDKEHKHFELVAGMAQNNYYIYGTGESTPDIIFDAYRHSNSVDLFQYIPDGHMQYISYFLGWGSIEEDYIELDEYYDEYVRYTLINMETVLATLPKDSLLVEPTKAEYESLYRKFMELYTNEAFQDDGTIKSEKRQQMYYLKERYPFSTIGSTMATAYHELQKQDFQKPDNWNTLMEMKTIKNDIPEQPIILYEGDLLPLSDELGRLYDQFVEGDYNKRTLVGLSLIDSFRLFLKANEENDLDAIFALSMESAYSQDNNYFINHYKVIDVDEMVHHYNEVRALSYEPLGINGIELFGEDRNISVNMEIHEDNWLVYPDVFYEDQNVE
ncbi:hypothetical protein Q73_11880 [Bacillus coahuilensis m2-6]|uniref:hypothetical protein n=2 Tax=Bacillus coahuilensis TaxID=408580 RepID=UPI0007503467|nr:hypothetical protein [Bacillus coahuilensis]KUP06076.1 hypothetical protein Q73_11880 [Bacillus coahuilensis m2-6]